jgi:hypothetical protein
VIAVATENEKFVVLSSANFNKNLRLEFFDITRSNELYEQVLTNYELFFRKNPIGKAVNNRKVIMDEFKSRFIREDLEDLEMVSEETEMELF